MNDVEINAQEIADEVVDRLNRQEWHDLHEMIEREVLSHFDANHSMIGASDLLKRNQGAMT